MSRPEGIRIEADVIERCGRAAAVGANWDTIARVAGVSRTTAWRWRKQGEADADIGANTDAARLVRAIRDGHARDAMSCLAAVSKAAQKGDIRAAIFKLERLHGYTERAAPDELSEASDPSTIADRLAALLARAAEAPEEVDP